MPLDPKKRTTTARRTNESSLQKQLLLWAGLAGVLAIWFLTPASDYITTYLLSIVPIESDIEMGIQAWNSMKQDYRSVPDIWRVQEVGHRLVRALPNEEQQALVWDFGVIHATFVNAFALPGGIVRITDALLHQLQLSEGELAALIGHEMGHVVHRHCQVRMLKEQLFGYLTKAILYEDNDDDRESFGEAIGELLLKSAAFVGAQRFSRNDEYEADATSWDLLIESRRYSPKAMQSLLQKLWDVNGGSGETSWESTHPGTKDRIAALQLKWNELPTFQRNKLEIDRKV